MGSLYSRDPNVLMNCNVLNVILVILLYITLENLSCTCQYCVFHFHYDTYEIYIYMYLLILYNIRNIFDKCQSALRTSERGNYTLVITL